MKTILMSAIAAAALLTGGAALASADLAKSAGCSRCHDMDKTRKGAPGYKEVAARYKGKADAEATILKAITDPKGDHPEVKASPDNLRSVVRWMISL